LLTVRLLHSADCPYVGVGGLGAGSESDDSAGGTVSILPHAPVLTPTGPCLEYIIADVTNRTDGREIFADIDLRLGRWDARRQYKFFDFAVVGDKFGDLSEQYIVCLATQTSLERLASLVQVAKHWSGAISTAVFAAGDDELYLLQVYLTYLRKCFATIRNRVSFHLAYPRDRPPTQIKSLNGIDFSNYDCAKPEATLLELLKHRTTDTTKWRLKNAYPQNHLRNVARKGCQTKNVFLTDVDIIPSINFTEHLDKFLRKNRCSNLCAYVVPTYELDNRARFPRDKLDLIRLAKKGLARPFHHKVFIYNQYATNFSR